jgi:hypothetical protein
MSYYVAVSVLLFVPEEIYNDTANRSLVSEFHLSDIGVKINPI